MWITCGGRALLATIADKLSSLPIAALRGYAGTLALWASAPQHGLQHYFKTHYADRTFEHLYHRNAFDTALLIPYFVVMIVLSFYGIHRYQLVYRYYKYRKNAARDPESLFAQLPTITVQLPIFNEQFVVDRLIQACCNLDYPADKLEIQVLDDSTDSTVEVAQAAVELYQSQDRHGADPLDPSQPRLQLPHAGGGHPARRPLCSGARRTIAHSQLFQFQWDRRHVAPHRDR